MVRLKLEFAVLFSSIVRDVPIDVPRRISIIQERFHENTKYLTEPIYDNCQQLVKQKLRNPTKEIYLLTPQKHQY